jgi:plasmid replication initiation protein
MVRVKKEIVKASNQIERAVITPANESVWDDRIISTLASRIGNYHETGFTEMELSLSELAPGIHLGGTAIKEIKKSIDRLIQAYFKIYLPSRDEDGRDFINFGIFEYIGYKEKKIVAKFSNGIRSHYFDLEKQYALRDVFVFRKLESTYSQMLYRLLNSWKSEPEVTIQLERLHDYLSTTPSLRNHFGHFKARVLEQACAEINSLPDSQVNFTWEPIRQGKQKIIAIRFIFTDPANEARRKRALSPGKKAATVSTPTKEAEDITTLQRESNACYERVVIKGGTTCKPKKRSKTCKYCLERGRMYAKNLSSKTPA